MPHPLSTPLLRSFGQAWGAAGLYRHCWIAGHAQVGSPLVGAAARRAGGLFGSEGRGETMN